MMQKDHGQSKRQFRGVNAQRPLSTDDLRRLAITKYREAKKLTKPKDRLKEYLEVLKLIPKSDLEPNITGSQLRVVAEDILLDILPGLTTQKLQDIGVSTPTPLSLSCLLVKICPRQDTYAHLKGTYYWCLHKDDQLNQTLNDIKEQDYENDILRRDAFNSWEADVKKVVVEIQNSVTMVDKLMRRHAGYRDDPNAAAGLSKEAGLLFWRKSNALPFTYLGNVYKTWSDLDDDYCIPSVDCYLEAKNLADQLKRESTSGGVLYNIGSLKLRLKQYDQALKYLGDDLKISLKLKDYRGAVVTRTKMAECYEANLELRRAEECLKRAKAEILSSSDADSMSDVLEELESLIEQQQVLKEKYTELKKLSWIDEDSQQIRPLQSLGKEQVLRYCELVKYCRAQMDFILGLKKSYPELTNLSSSARSDDVVSLFSIPDFKYSSEDSINPLMSKLLRHSQQFPSIVSALPTSDILRPLVAWSDHLKTLVAEDPLPLLNAVLDMMLCSSLTKNKSLPLLKKVLDLRTQKILDLPPGAADKVPMANLTNRNGQNPAQARSPLEEFVADIAEYANALDDCFYHKNLSQVPAAVEEEFANVLHMAIQGGFTKLVAVVLVNLEIIYKKYKDFTMLERVEQQIEQFKTHKDPRKIVLVISKRVGMVAESDTRQAGPRASSSSAGGGRPTDNLHRGAEFMRTSRGVIDVLDPLGLKFMIRMANNVRIRQLKVLKHKSPSKTREDSASREVQPRFIEEESREDSNSQMSVNQRFWSGLKLASAGGSLGEDQPTMPSANAPAKSHTDRLRLLALSQMQSSMCGVSFSGIGGAVKAGYVAELNLQEIFKSADLHLGRKHLGERTWLDIYSQIFPALKQLSNSRLRSLDLSHSKITKKMVQTIVNSSSFFLSSLQSLNISACRMVVSDAASIVQNLNPLVSEVRLGGSIEKLKTTNVDDHVQMLSIIEQTLNRKNLRVAGFENLGLTSLEGMQFPVLHSLEELRLAHNRFSATEILKLILSIPTCFPSLQRLDLSFQEPQPWKPADIPDLTESEAAEQVERSVSNPVPQRVKEPEQLKGKPDQWIDLTRNTQFAELLSVLYSGFGVWGLGFGLSLLSGTSHVASPVWRVFCAVIIRFQKIRFAGAQDDPVVRQFEQRVMSYATERAAGLEEFCPPNLLFIF